MLNQIRRIWADTGSDDKHFDLQEQNLREALLDLKKAADDLSRASQVLLDVIRKED